MRIAIASTNPCHLFPLAVELAALQQLDCYYSGYPTWKLRAPESMPVRTHSLRTNIVYGMLKYIPARFRPETRDLFLWQDRGFDAWVGHALAACDYVHAMPGQCMQTFTRAKALGARPVLNHATGPVREWVRIMEPEYRRAGLNLRDVCPYDEDYFRREDREYALADFHCAASTIVRDQLIALGIAPARIWVVPYGADPAIFFPADEPRTGKFRIVFAGQAGLRKDVRTLLQALELSGEADWEVDFYGAVLPEADRGFSSYRGKPALRFHGPVSQRALADAFRSASVLALPSLEEGFGLVVPQALNCGLPCIVSDRVGAKDLIRHHGNGSVFPTRNVEGLLEELQWWEARRDRVSGIFDWRKPTETLISLGNAASSKP